MRIIVLLWAFILAFPAVAFVAGQRHPVTAKEPFRRLQNLMERIQEDASGKALIDPLETQNSVRFGAGVIVGFVSLSAVKSIGKAFIGMAAGAAFLSWMLQSRNKVEDDLGISVSVDSEKIRKSLIHVVDLDQNGVFDFNDFEEGVGRIWRKAKPLIQKFKVFALGCGAGLALAFFL